MIKTLNLDYDWAIDIQHKFKGTFLGVHAVVLNLGRPGEKTEVVLDVKSAREFAAELLKFLPEECDYSPDGFREALVGRSFKEIWEDEGRRIVGSLAHKNGLTWEEMHECKEGSPEAAEARKGEDECCVWLIHKDDKITDVVWG